MVDSRRITMALVINRLHDTQAFRVFWYDNICGLGFFAFVNYFVDVNNKLETLNDPVDI